MEVHEKYMNVVRDLMVRVGYSNLKDLAEKLGIHPGTLTNNVKNFSRNKNYQSQFAIKLFDVLQVTEDEFKSQLGATALKDSKSYLEFINTKIQEFALQAQNYQLEIVQLLQTLDEGDTYTFITSDAPYEFIDEGFKEVIMSAIDKDVKLNYVFPNPIELDSRFANYWPRLGSEWKELGTFYEDFVVKSVDETSGREEKNLRRNLKFHHSDDPFLIHPFFNFMWLKKKSESGFQNFVFVETRIGSSVGISKEAPRFWHPLPRIESQRIYKMVEKIINEDGK